MNIDQLVKDLVNKNTIDKNKLTKEEMTKRLNTTFETNFKEAIDILGKRFEIPKDFQAVDVPIKMEYYQEGLMTNNNRKVICLLEWNVQSSRSKLVKAVTHRGFLNWPSCQLYVSCKFEGMEFDLIAVDSQKVKPILRLPSGRILYEESFDDDATTVAVYNLGFVLDKFWMKWIMEQELKSNLLIRFPKEMLLDKDGVEFTFPPNEEFLKSKDRLILWNEDQCDRLVVINLPVFGFPEMKMMREQRENTNFVISRRKLGRRFMTEDAVEISVVELSRISAKEEDSEPFSISGMDN
jgi:hypothetical protein